MPRDRLIRLFVSSTFRDMRGEREVLATKVFPILRHQCHERQVEFVEVDLRWGITEVEAERGEAVGLCLDEVDTSRPYFLGLLGERYGWIPDEIGVSIIERHPRALDWLGKSVTEMEIRHGVLDTQGPTPRALFYFRDPAFARRMAWLPEALEAARALAELKSRIRESGHPVREPYSDPEELGSLVLEDLTALLDREYPAGSEPDPLDREAAEHEAFAEARSRVYVARPGAFERLDQHADGDGPPLVIQGESGSGKSALLANWILRRRASHPDEFLLVHHIGSTPASADHLAMLRRILGELRRRFEISDPVPDTPEGLRSAFPNRLSMAAARARVVLVLDALDQLEDRDGAPDLLWLPELLPPRIRLVVSTLPGRSAAALEQMNWESYRVLPLTETERSGNASRDRKRSSASTSASPRASPLAPSMHGNSKSSPGSSPGLAPGSASTLSWPTSRSSIAPGRPASSR